MTSLTVSPERSRRPPSWPLWSAGLALFVGGVACLGVGGMRITRTLLFQSSQTRAVLEVSRPPLGRAEATGRATAPRAVALAPGVLGIVAIPRVGLSAVVKEGADRDTMAVAAGHIPGTALFGEGGNIGVTAHRDGLFRRLARVRLGDVVNVTTPGGSYSYLITDTQIVTPDHVEVLDPTPKETLTLVTCYPFRYVGGAPQRFVVTARRIAAARAGLTASHFPLLEAPTRVAVKASTSIP